MPWVHLGIAIASEVFATSCLKASAGFTRLAPSTGVAVGYALAFYFLSRTLEVIPVGIAYAVWSGVGVAAITLIGWLRFGQALDGPALGGIGLIVAGVVLLSAFSRAAVH